ncbi:MAG: glycosyltransferase family 1 protein [Pseudomonadota bacterium]
MSQLILNGRFLTRAATGVDRVAMELVSALLTRGLPEPFKALVTLAPNAPVVDESERPDAILSRLTPTPSRLNGHPWEQVTLARAAPQDWLLSLCNTGPITRARQVVMIHDAQVFTQPQSYSRAFRTLYHLFQPRLARKAALVLTVSDYSKRELERLKVVPEGQCQVVHNGADHIVRVDPDETVLQRHGLIPGGYLLAIGSLAAHKNLPMAVAAANARPDTSMPLVIAGGGNSAVFAEAGIQASETVKPIGRVSDAELRALYGNATALVFPSFTEGFGLPAAEAMMCGAPVIASTGGAIPEVCGEAALLLDPNDREGWTAALTRVCADPALRHRLSEAGRTHVTRFTWAHAADTLAGYLAALPGSR